jgi:predicted  nucleic acid-binding Zn-ribbon protein
MTTQPEALRLADELGKLWLADRQSSETREEAAAELRRLHDELAESQKWRDREEARAERAEAQRDELLQALKDATDAIEHWGTYATEYFQKKWGLQSDINAARAAIAKAEGEEK